MEDQQLGPGHIGRGGDREGEIEQLVRRAAAGDQVAWELLVERFAGLLWSICRSHRLSQADAADAFQQTWLRLLENLGAVRDPNRLPAWLATTCRRECLAVLRRGKRWLPTADDGWLDQRAGRTAAADRPVLASDRDATLRGAFGRLGERCQQVLRVLVLADAADRPSYEMAAAALDMPIGSLGPTRARCLERLRILLDTVGITTSATDS